MNIERESANRLIAVTDASNQQCTACVFYPPNLPANAYPEDDYRMLQAKSCCFDHRPGDSDCVQSRKTSCSLLDLEHLS